MKSKLKSSYGNGSKSGINRRNPITAYWMKEEIWAHDDRLIFPDWSHLAHRGMERLRRDDSANYQKRREQALAQKLEYRQRPEVKAAQAKRQRDKKASDPGYRVERNLSRRLYALLFDSGTSKQDPTINVVGCSRDELRNHLERQFTKGISWENYGKVWQVDHILPCSSFDHSYPEQVAACWHWTNLRPLRSELNAAKSDRITHPQMSLRMEFH